MTTPTDVDPSDLSETAGVICGEPQPLDVIDAPLVTAVVDGDPIEDTIASPLADMFLKAGSDRDLGALAAADTLDAPATFQIAALMAPAAPPKHTPPQTLTQAQAVTILRHLGWRIRSTGEYRQVVLHFQDAWCLGAPLKADGQVGPLTSAALRVSESRRRRDLCTASTHFSFAQFACKCGGSHADCARIWVRGDLIRALEALRKRVPAYAAHGLAIVSGCRCPGHNAHVGGVRSSQHQYGAAADIEYAVGSSLLARWRLFSGIGRSARTHLVRHVDVRHESGHNTTRASRTHPTIWNYAS